MRTLKRLIPAAVLAVLSACSVQPPTSATATATTEAGPVLLVREQADPPQPLLEHPGRPPANGYVWMAGRWDLVDGRYRWQAGSWAAPRPGHVWQAHVWRRVGDRWLQEGGRWVPDANGLALPRRR